jgi:hypothetical protein
MDCEPIVEEVFGAILQNGDCAAKWLRRACDLNEQAARRMRSLKIRACTTVSAAFTNRRLSARYYPLKSNASSPTSRFVVGSPLIYKKRPVQFMLIVRTLIHPAFICFEPDAFDVNLPH